MPRRSLLLLLVTIDVACGSRRVAGYLEQLEDCAASVAAVTDCDIGGETGSSGTTADTTSAASETTGTGSDASEAGSSTTGGSGGAAESTTRADSSTGAPAAVCGNGQLEDLGPEPEECDDGNLVPDDGCGATCALDRRVFVTSKRFQGGDFLTLWQADARCANLADDQGWPDGLQYRAWLSDSTTDARDRFARGRGRLVMANGLVLAASWSALLAGQLERPLEVTETSQTYHGGVWTGTRPDGTAVPGAEHCEDWATELALKRGHYGYSDRTTSEWTLSEGLDQPALCFADFALYCFQSL